MDRVPGVLETLEGFVHMIPRSVSSLMSDLFHRHWVRSKDFENPSVNRFHVLQIRGKIQGIKRNFLRVLLYFQFMLPTNNDDSNRLFRVAIPSTLDRLPAKSEHLMMAQCSFLLGSDKLNGELPIRIVGFFPTETISAMRKNERKSGKSLEGEGQLAYLS